MQRLGTNCSSEASALVSGDAKRVPACLLVYGKKHTNTEKVLTQPSDSLLSFTLPFSFIKVLHNGKKGTEFHINVGFGESV